MDAEEMKKYEEAVRDVIGMHAIVLGRGGAGYVEFDAWLAAHDAEVRAQVVAEEPEGDDEPCKAEIWSWDIFRHQEVDPYWMRCHRIGAHDKHENSETGATWPVKQEGAEG